VLACAARLCRQRAGSSYRNRHQRQRRGRERPCEPCRSRAGGQCGAKGHAGPQNVFRYMFGGLVPLCLPAMLPCSPPCRAVTLVPAARKFPAVADIVAILFLFLEKCIVAGFNLDIVVRRGRDSVLACIGFLKRNHLRYRSRLAFILIGHRRVLGRARAARPEQRSRISGMGMTRREGDAGNGGDPFWTRPATSTPSFGWRM
jgi:hypothetical protein